MLATSLSPKRKIGLRASFERQLGAERADGGADGRGVARVGQLDRQQQLERRAAIGQRVEELAGDEQDAAPLLGDELDQVLHLRLAQEAGVGVAEDHDVVGEEIVLGRRKRRQGGAVLLAVLRIGREQDDVQVDRLVALEIVLQIAEFVPRLAVDVAGP